MNDKEAKEILKTMKENIDKKYLKTRNSVAIETVLNLLENQKAEIEQLKIAGNGIELLLKQKVAEIEKKDKIIDLMAEEFVKAHEWFYSEFDNYTKEDFIKYFEKKSEEDK